MQETSRGIGGSPYQVARSRSWHPPPPQGTRVGHKLLLLNPDGTQATTPSPQGSPKGDRSQEDARVITRSDSGSGGEESPEANRRPPNGTLSLSPPLPIVNTGASSRASEISKVQRKIQELDSEFERCKDQLGVVSDQQQNLREGITQTQAHLNELENTARGLRLLIGNEQYELGNLALKSKGLLDHIRSRAVERKKAEDDLQTLLAISCSPSGNNGDRYYNEESVENGR